MFINILHIVILEVVALPPGTHEVVPMLLPVMQPALYYLRARKLCNHLGLYVCMCVCVYVCVCVFVCEHDNSRNTKHIHTKFFECKS
jgi:hypothetical protein